MCAHGYKELQQNYWDLYPNANNTTIDELVMPLKDCHRVNRFSEIPKTKRRIATCRHHQFLRQMCTAVIQFVIMTWKVYSLHKMQHFTNHHNRHQWNVKTYYAMTKRGRRGGTRKENENALNFLQLLPSCTRHFPFYPKLWHHQVPNKNSPLTFLNCYGNAEA